MGSLTRFIIQYLCFLLLMILSACSLDQTSTATIERKEHHIYTKDGVILIQNTEAYVNNKEKNQTNEFEEIPLLNNDTVEENDANFFDEELEKDLRYNKSYSTDNTNDAHDAKTNLTSQASDLKYPSPLNSTKFIWPIEGKVLDHYGKKADHFNEGINIAAPLGTVVRAAAAGEVVYVGYEPKIYGNLVIIRHDQYLTAYAHNSKIRVIKGAHVTKGEPIATVGKTGNVSQPQLHFSMRKDKKTIDPEKAE